MKTKVIPASAKNSLKAKPAGEILKDAPEAEPEVEYLNEKARGYLSLSDHERIQKIFAPRWLGYARAKEIHIRLSDLYYYPKVDRMPNALVVGDSNAGKSETVNRFVNEQNESDAIAGERLPIFRIQATPRGDLRDFYSACLRSINSPFPPRYKPFELRDLLIHVLTRLQTRMIVVDEVHSMLTGNPLSQRDFLGSLKYLGNEMRIPIVAIGTKDALWAFRSDDQLANRFEPIPIPRWTDGVEFRQLLLSFEYTTPLKKPSHLISDELAAKLLIMSDGLIGELAELLRRAAVKAVRTGRECIDAYLLDGLGWVQPKDRNATAAKRLDG